MALKKDIKKPVPADKQGLVRISEKDRPFSKLNYYMMGGCVALIVIGFMLMSGGGSTVENGFNPEIFSTRRIIVGPMFAFFGFLLMAFAIIYTPASRRKEEKIDLEKPVKEVVPEEPVKEKVEVTEISTNQ